MIDCGFYSYDLLSGRITKEWNFDKSSRLIVLIFLFSIFAQEVWKTSVFLGKLKDQDQLLNGGFSTAKEL